MQVENFMTHFRKSKKSAIIVGGDRSAGARAPVSLFSEWMIGMDVQVLLMSAAIKTAGGMIFGALGALPVPALLTKLEARGLIPKANNSGAAA